MKVPKSPWSQTTAAASPWVRRRRTSAASGLLTFCVALATAALVGGYLQGGNLPLALLALALGGLWLVGHWWSWTWTDSIGLAFVVGSAAGGMWLGMGAGWMLGATVAALCAWDLEAFSRWVAEVVPAERARALTRRHLVRLLGVIGAGVVLAAFALQARVRLGLALMLLLGLVTMLGVSRAVNFLRHQAESEWSEPER